MARAVYIAGVGLTKVDLTGRVFGSVFDLFAEAYELALGDSRVRSFDAMQIGIMDSEEFENRANIAAKVADRLGLRGIPAVRTETASSTGAAAFHEAFYKVASEQCESVLVLAGERMKNVTTDAATAIMSKTVDPVERRFGFTMPGLIALVTQAWFRRRGVDAKELPEILARLMFRAHALGAENPKAAFFGRPEKLESYFDESRNLPVATPLMRKDCSPICDGAAAVILTSRPDAVRVAGLGSATESSSILDRKVLRHMDATRAAARIAYWRAGIRDPRALEKVVVECHDAFNSLLPINLYDLGLVADKEAVSALIGDPRATPGDPLAHPVSGVSGRIPTNLSGGLKARGHPVGGTGLFQIVEATLQLTERFPNPRAQVQGARLGITHSIGGPGNNNYVTVLERSDSGRHREHVPEPRRNFQSAPGTWHHPEPDVDRHGARAVVEAATTIHVTGESNPKPIHVAVVAIDGGRMFAKLDHPPDQEEPPEQVLAGQRVKLLVKDDGDHYFQLDRGRLGLSRFVDRVRERMLGGGAPASAPAGPAATPPAAPPASTDEEA